MLSNAFLLLTLLAATANADGIYTKKSPVLQLNQETYGSLIANSNYTSIVEFYAPWCGHCQNLKGAYEKAAENLNGLAKVAAINCDDDENKPFCGQMGVKGFPTLKIVTPSKKPGQPRVEDYQGARTANAIINAVADRIPNHVKRATDKDLDKWLEQEKMPKAILFTEKGTTSSLIRALAIDFLNAIDIAQVRNKESASVEKFGITKFPTLVVIPGGDAELKVYEGELKKKPMTEFLSQFATPNPDAAGQPSTKPDSKPKPKSSKPAKAAPVPDADTEEAPAAKPVEVPPVPTLATPESLESTCLAAKSNTCVLALLLPESEEVAKSALESLADIKHRHSQRGAHIFPIYVVPDVNSASQNLRNSLGLSNSVEIVAINARRGWWRRYENTADFGVAAVEQWIDAIRLGEGIKEKLPEGVVVDAKVESESEPEKRKETAQDEL